MGAVGFGVRQVHDGVMNMEVIVDSEFGRSEYHYHYSGCWVV